MKKCNICGIEISQNSEKVICDNCEIKNRPTIENRNLEFILVIGFLIIGIIYTYGGYYSIKYNDPFFESNFHWIIVDLIGCWLVYKWNWTDGILLEGGTGPFFGIPILTILCLLPGIVTFLPSNMIG